MALRAKFKFETDVFFMILLRKIMKNTSVSKEYFAAPGGKNLFTQPLPTKILRGEAADTEVKSYILKPKNMKKFIFIFLLGAALTKVSAQTQILTVNPEFATVDGVIKNLYDVISGPAGQVRDWNKMRDLFRPEARLSSLGVDRDGKPRFVTMAIEDYIRNSGPNFEQNGFFEREIGRATEQYGDMVHIFSAYEARREENGTPYMRGVNSIQLIKKDGRFWIVNIVWNTETKENPIPAKYLNK